MGDIGRPAREPDVAERFRLALARLCPVLAELRVELAELGGQSVSPGRRAGVARDEPAVVALACLLSNLGAQPFTTAAASRLLLTGERLVRRSTLVVMVGCGVQVRSRSSFSASAFLASAISSANRFSIRSSWAATSSRNDRRQLSGSLCG